MPQGVHGWMLVGERLGGDARQIIAQVYRRRTEVRAVFGIAAGAFAAQIGQLELVIVHRRGAAMYDQLILFDLPQQFLNQDEWELYLVGNFVAVGIALRQEEFEDQRFDFAFGKLGGRKRRGLDGIKFIGC